MNSIHDEAIRPRFLGNSNQENNALYQSEQAWNHFAENDLLIAANSLAQSYGYRTNRFLHREDFRLGILQCREFFKESITELCKI